LGSEPAALARLTPEAVASESRVCFDSQSRSAMKTDLKEKNGKPTALKLSSLEA